MNIRLEKNCWKKSFPHTLWFIVWTVARMCAVHKCMTLEIIDLSIDSFAISHLSMFSFQFFAASGERCCTFTTSCTSRNVSTNQNQDPLSSGITCRKDIKTQNMNSPTGTLVKTQAFQALTTTTTSSMLFQNYQMKWISRVSSVHCEHVHLQFNHSIWSVLLTA